MAVETSKRFELVDGCERVIPDIACYPEFPRYRNRFGPTSSGANGFSGGECGEKA